MKPGHLHAWLRFGRLVAGVRPALLHLLTASSLSLALCDVAAGAFPQGNSGEGKSADPSPANRRDEPPPELARFFRPPEEYRDQYGEFRSPLIFADSTPVRTAADWERRRAEIRETWHRLMGPWPALIENPRVETVATTRRENLTQHQLRIEIALGNGMVDAFLLVPDGDGPFPAVLALYYDAQTGVGLGTPLRDYGG